MGGTAAAMQGEAWSWLQDKSCCASSPFLDHSEDKALRSPCSLPGAPRAEGAGNVWPWMWERTGGSGLLQPPHC